MNKKDDNSLIGHTSLTTSSLHTVSGLSIYDGSLTIRDSSDIDKMLTTLGILKIGIPIILHHSLKIEYADQIEEKVRTLSRELIDKVIELKVECKLSGNHLDTNSFKKERMAINKLVDIYIGGKDHLKI